jgi:hypothetical protein
LVAQEYRREHERRGTNESHEKENSNEVSVDENYTG